MDTIVERVPMAHLVMGGRPHDVPLNELDVGDNSTHEQIKQAAASFLEIPYAKIRDYEVHPNAETGDLTIAPPATFG